MKSQKNKNKENLSTPLFADHLEKLELLSLATRRLTETLPRNASAEKTLCLMWDILSQFVTLQSASDLTELGTLSSIVQRLASATKQIQSLEEDSVNLVRKSIDLESVRQALLKSLAADVDKPDGISAQTLAIIERRLRLM